MHGGRYTGGSDGMHVPVSWSSVAWVANSIRNPWSLLDSSARRERSQPLREGTGQRCLTPRLCRYTISVS